MDFIKDGIWIGDSGDAKNAVILNSQTVVSILNVAFDLDYIGSTNHICCKVGLIDGPGNSYESFELAVELLDKLLKKGPVLLHCHEGKSRSVSVAIAYLATKYDMSVDDVIANIKTRRPQIEPKEAVLLLAKKYIEAKKKDCI